MQTFLPYPDFQKSASVLDNKRLGKQRVECLQILTALAIGPHQRALKSNAWLWWKPCPPEEYKKDYTLFVYRLTPWYNHPATRMWRGYEQMLIRYAFSMCLEWTRRGHIDTCMHKIIVFDNPVRPLTHPPFIGNEAFHAAHRSNLLRKDPKHYGQFGWTEPNNLPYIWPV